MTGDMLEWCDQGPQTIKWYTYRPEWDQIWMGLAVTLSQRSTCKTPNRQVGCVIISEDNTSVLAIGYNGGAKGDDNLCAYSEIVKVGTSRCTCAHAEMNALTKLNTTDPRKKKLYTTLSPCALCANLIVNGGIDEVIYLTVYDEGVIGSLQSHGITVRRI